MKSYQVKAELVDIHTGKRLAAGDTLKTEDAEQVERLTRAGCLGDEIKAKVDDGLGKLKPEELADIVKAEGVEVAADATPKQIVAAIRAKRTAA